MPCHYIHLLYQYKRTNTDSLYSLQGAPLPCHYMQKKEKRMLWGETQTAEMVMLPYGQGKRVGAYVALPKQAGKEGLTAAVEELFGSDASWEEAVNTLGAQFTCFTSTKVQMLTQKGGGHPRIPAGGTRTAAVQG
jgi:hypothetical protein